MYNSINTLQLILQTHFYFKFPFLCRIIGDICIILVSGDQQASDASEFASGLVIQTRNREKQDFWSNESS